MKDDRDPFPLTPRHFGLVTAIGAVAVLAGFLTIGFAPSAQALPSFARQTGQPCGTCHTDFPALTPFGRRFKLLGYTVGGGEFRTTPFPSFLSSNDSRTQPDKMYFDVRPWLDPSFVTGTTATFPQSDKYTDTGFDAQYQYQGNNYWLTLRGSYIREYQKLDASFPNMLSANPTDELDSLRLQASFAYASTRRSCPGFGLDLLRRGQLPGLRFATSTLS